MKRRLISLLLTLSMVFGIIPILPVTVNAATTLTISQPDNWEFISKSDPPSLKWNKITGAAGYRVTVKNDKTGAYYTQNEWTTKTSYSLADLFDEKLSSSEYPQLKIWVGAMASKNDDPGLTSISNTYIIAVVSEAPDISISTPSSITSDGATLKVTVDKNYGSGILDAGFYIGTSSSKSKAQKYSVEDFGPSSIIDSGTMTMKVKGLKSDTKYYVWGYAENAVDETITSSYKTFRTEEAEEETGGAKFDHKPTLDLNISGNYLGNNVYGTYYPGDTIYFKCTADYTDHVYIEINNKQLVFWTPSGIQNYYSTFVEKTSESESKYKSYTNGKEFEIHIPVPEGIKAGDYTISVTATDGVFDPDTNSSIPGTSYYNSVKESLTVRIGAKSEDNPTIGSYVKIDSTVQTIDNKYVYKGSGQGRTQLVKPYYYLEPSRDIEASVNVDTLKLIIDQFDVLNSHDSSHSNFGKGFYYPYGGSTYCTTYARDVANAYGACFPSYVCSKCGLVKNMSSYMGEKILTYLDKNNLLCKSSCDGKSSSLLAFHVSGGASGQTETNDPYCFMMKYGSKYGWEHITSNKVNAAMQYANEGYLTIGLYSDYNKKAGHVFVVYPTNDTTMHQAQAGGTNVMSDGSLEWNANGGSTYRRSPSNSWIEYFVYKGIQPHTHSFSDPQYEPEHPHEGYRECACGYSEATNTTKKLDTCKECYPATPSFTPGDINMDGKKDMNDVVKLILHIYARIPIQYPGSPDTNGDGKKDMNDIVKLILHIYAKLPIKY